MEILPMEKVNLSNSVKAYLIKYIRGMDAKLGTKLPPENEMAKNFSVSRVTIRRALDDLEKEGLILRIHGKGTFVNPDALQIKTSLLPGGEFRQLIRDSGYEAKFEIQRFEKLLSDGEVSRKLEIPLGTPYYLLEKLYFADQHPAIVSIDRVPCEYFYQDPDSAELNELSIFHILKHKAGCIIKRDKIEIETMDLAKMKHYSSCSEKMECSSVLCFHGINYDQNNRPVILDTEFYNTDYIRFNMIRVKDVYKD